MPEPSRVPGASYTDEVTGRRRMAPVALVGPLGLLTLAAAAIGVAGSPTPEQTSLENAALRTAEATSFSYSMGDQIASIRPGGRTTSAQLHGVWRAPDQWQVSNPAGGAASTTTVVGSTLHVSSGRFPPAVFQFSSPGLTESLTDPRSPVVSLPPLGLVFAATNITRTGDTYSFVVPVLNIGVTGWVAYAPLSQATTSLTLTRALNTRADVVIKNGYVTSFDFPDGIRPLRGGASHHANWQISRIGNATFLEPAKSG
jgi:hypothetical protein